MALYLIGQRVIIGDEIGTVQRGPTMLHGPPKQDTTVQQKGYVWVHLPSKGYASHYDERNVNPLPGGQL